MKKNLFHAALFTLALIAPASTAQEGIPLRGQDYIRDTVKLSRSLGAAHAVRVRCNGRDDQYWRKYMQEFLELEAPNRGSLRSSLVDGFNASYQQVSARYLSCDSLAVEAEKRYAAEGKTLTDRLATHYFPKVTRRMVGTEDAKEYDPEMDSGWRPAPGQRQ